MRDDDWPLRTTTALRRGDPAPLAEIYDHLGADTARVVASITRRGEEFALDCLQDTMVTLATKPPLCQLEAELRAWLRTVALNHARTHLLADARRLRRETSVAYLRSECVDQSPYASAHESAAALSEIEEALKHAEASLSTEEFEVVNLVVWRGVRRRVAATVIGRSAATVDRVLVRALGVLRGPMQ